MIVPIYAADDGTAGPGTKSENILAFTTSNMTYYNGGNAPGDTRNVDSLYPQYDPTYKPGNTNHTNRSAGNDAKTAHNLLVYDKTRFPKLPMDGRDTVPYYNKAVIDVAVWNTESIQLRHGTTSERNGDITGDLWTSERITVNASSAENSNAFGKRLAFSFDKTNHQFLGYSNIYYANAANGGINPFYVKEFEAYYVTPNSIAVTGQDQYNILPNTPTELSAEIYDVDGDVIRDSELCGVKWEINSVPGVSIDAGTGLITIDSSFTSGDVMVTATSTYNDTLVAQKTIGLANAAMDGVPVGVSISTAQSLYDVDAGSEITIDGGVVDAKGTVLADKQLSWAITTNCPGLTVENGVVRMSASIDKAYDVKVTATYLGDGVTYSGDTTFKVKSAKKSLNLAYRAAGSVRFGYSGNTDVDTKATDGNMGTVLDHTNRAADPAQYLDAWVNMKKTFDGVEKDAVPQYNKLVMYPLCWNNTTITFKRGTVGDRHGEIKDANKTWEGNPIDIYSSENKSNPENLNPDREKRLAISFDTTTDQYIGWRTWHLESPPTASRSFRVAEVEVYYVTPDKIEISGPDKYTVKKDASISLSGSFLDVDGDEILDKNMTGDITWSMSGGSNATINPKTGSITVNSNIQSPEVYTVTATSANAAYPCTGTKKITLFGNEISSLKIQDVPDFIMTNKEQGGKSSFNLKAAAYGFEGEELSGKSVEWSLAESAEGVTLTKEGVLTIDSAAATAEYITVNCRATGENESASDSVKIVLNKKINLVANSTAWGTHGWMDANHPFSHALDENTETYFSSGSHNGSSATMIIDTGAGAKANFIEFNLLTNMNSLLLRVAASDSLVNRIASSTAMNPPADTDKTYAWNGSTNYPVLAPYTVGVDTMGTEIYVAHTPGLEVTQALKDKGITSNGAELAAPRTGVYLEKPMTEPKRYISVTNWSNQQTTGDMAYQVYEFGLYNTAPNYIAIDVPEPVAVTAGKVQLSAKVYNGVMDEAPKGTFSWQAGKFNIAADSGELTIPTTENVIDTITANYTADGFTSEASIYAWVEGGSIHFSSSLAGYYGIEAKADSLAEIKGDTIYVPQGATAQQVMDAVSHRTGSSIEVTDAAYDAVTGDVVDGNIVSVYTGDYENTVEYKIALTAGPKLSLEGDEAKAVLGSDTPEAALVISEYDADGRLVDIKYAAKTKPAEAILLKLNSNAEGHTFKAMLVNSLKGLKPLVPSVTK